MGGHRGSSVFQTVGSGSGSIDWLHHQVGLAPKRSEANHPDAVASLAPGSTGKAGFERSEIWVQGTDGLRTIVSQATRSVWP